MSIFEIDIKKAKPDNFSQIFFGMGCFWGAERKFWHLDGSTLPLLVMQGDILRSKL